MYIDEQPLIEAFARDSPERTAHVVKFVLATIRCPLERVPIRLTNALRGNDREMHPASRDGIKYVDRNDVSVPSIVMPHGYNDVELLRHYLDVPGLGIVKAGFVCQLLHGRVGCLDVHNIRMYGLNKSAFQRPPTVAALNKRLELYVKTCEIIGGTAYLWDSWCSEVARLRPYRWKDANEVSRFHWTAIYETHEGE